MSAALRSWLLDPGSLTAKLRGISQGQFQVRVLRQAVESPSVSEQRRLGLGSGRWVLVREVLLLVRGEPWVFARSLIPVTSLVGRLRRLRYLNDQPLGAFLFSHSGLDRGTLEVGRIAASQGYVPPDVTGDSRYLWGRRSVFRLDRKPLLVSEVFLEPFAQYLSMQGNFLHKPK